MRGRLVVVEGIDGSGKSTLIRALSGLPAVVTTREPTQGPHGAALREAFASGRRLRPVEERRLVEADRREHVAATLVPALARGETVICDRSYYSTAAYQGSSADNARAIVVENERFAIRPDILIFLDVPPVFALARIQARGGAPAAPETYENLLACARRYEAVWASPDLMAGITFVRLDAREHPDQLAGVAQRLIAGVGECVAAPSDGWSSRGLPR